MEEQREYVDFLFSPPAHPWLRFQPAPLRSSHCLETLPRDPRCILEKRAPVRNGAHPNWHLAGHGRLACSQVPAAALRACTLGRASIIHCLLFINNPSPHPHLLHCPALHIHIYIFIFHTPSFIILTFHTDFGASLLWLWAMRASVPSVQYAEGTACLTCHCRRNKGVRYDTCPCYSPLCIFYVSAIPSGQKSVSDKSHKMENKFWTLSRTLTGLILCFLKTSSVTQNFIFITWRFNIMRLLGQSRLNGKRFEQKARLWSDGGW